MASTPRLALLVATLFVPACDGWTVDTDANVSVSGSMRFALGDFGEVCGGSGTVTDDHGVTTWTESPVDGGCRVDIQWDGLIVDVPFVRAEIQKNLDAETKLSDVTLTDIVLTFENLAMRDAAGADLTPPDLSDLAAAVRVGERELLAVDEDAVVSLLSTPLVITLDADTVAEADRLLHDLEAGPLRASASGHVVVPSSAIPGLTAADRAAVVLQLKIDVTASISKKIL